MGEFVNEIIRTAYENIVCNKKILHNLQTRRQKYSMKAVIWWFADTAVFFPIFFPHHADIFRNKANIIFNSSAFS